MHMHMRNKHELCIQSLHADLASLCVVLCKYALFAYLDAWHEYMLLKHAFMHSIHECRFGIFLCDAVWMRSINTCYFGMNGWNAHCMNGCTTSITFSVWWVYDRFMYTCTLHEWMQHEHHSFRLMSAWSIYIHVYLTHMKHSTIYFIMVCLCAVYSCFEPLHFRLSMNHDSIVKFLIHALHSSMLNIYESCKWTQRVAWKRRLHQAA